MPILFFRLLSCSDICLLYTLNRKCQHLFSPFFTFFRYFFLPPQKKEKAALFPWNQSCLFIPSSMLFQHRQYILRNLLCSQMVFLHNVFGIVSVKKFLLQAEIQHFYIRIPIESCDFLTETAVQNSILQCDHHRMILFQSFQ